MIDSYEKSKEFLDNKNYNDAIEHLRLCINEIKNLPYYSSYCANQLAIIFDKGLGNQMVDLPSALYYYKQAYSIIPDEANIFNYANILLKMSLFENSLPLLNKCLSTENVSVFYKSWCSNQLGLIFEHGKTGEASSIKAKNYYVLAYEYNKQDFFNLYNLAIIFNKLKNDNEDYYAKAKKYLNTCSKKSGSEIKIYVDNCKDLLKIFDQGPNNIPQAVEVNINGEIETAISEI